MKLIKLLPIVILAAAIGGFVYLGFTDVTIEQKEVSKEIPHEKLFDD